MSFIIPALNTGNVTQQRLQGNQNAQAIADLQTQVSSLQTDSITGTLNVAANVGGIASNTTQTFSTTLSDTVPAGAVIVWSLAEGSGPISTSGGVVLQMIEVSGDTVTMALNNSWGSTQGWNAFTLNFKVVE